LIKMIKAILMDFGDTIVVEEEGKRLSDMELKPVAGAGKFLEEFSSVPIMIISNTIHSNHRDIEKLLEELGFIRHIRRVITSLDFGSPKPDPGIYQSALEPLGVKPNEAVMIGDRMDVDIEGAHRAGIVSIHLHWRSRHDDKKAPSLVEPTYRVASFAEASKVLRKLMPGGSCTPDPSTANRSGA